MRVVIDGVHLATFSDFREKRRSQMIPKFRAWSKVNIESPEMREVRGINWHGHNVWFNDFLDDETPADWADFDDIILMQSTGLFDKNGVEIFEGDFIALDELTYVVKQGIHKFSRFEGVGFYLLIDMGDIYIVDPMVTDGNRLEVIGNIHEHPDLVEVGND